MDSAWSDRSQRRTALVCREIGWYDIQIAALSEIWFADVGEMIKKVGAENTFFWRGRKCEERRETEVGKIVGIRMGTNCAPL